MPEREPMDVTNLDRYGNPPLPWSRPRALLAGGAPGPEIPMFLSTTRPDGRPHTAVIGALWHDGDLVPGIRRETGKVGMRDQGPVAFLAQEQPLLPRDDLERLIR